MKKDVLIVWIICLMFAAYFALPLIDVTFLETYLADYSDFINIIAGIIILLFGLYYSKSRKPKKPSIASASH